MWHFVQANTFPRSAEEMLDGTSLPMPELLTRASCRKDWKRISAEPSLTSPQQPNRSRDRTEHFSTHIYCNSQYQLLPHGCWKFLVLTTPITLIVTPHTGPASPLCAQEPNQCQAVSSSLKAYISNVLLVSILNWTSELCPTAQWDFMSAASFLQRCGVPCNLGSCTPPQKKRPCPQQTKHQLTIVAFCMSTCYRWPSLPPCPVTK